MLRRGEVGRGKDGGVRESVIGTGGWVVSCGGEREGGKNGVQEGRKGGRWRYKRRSEGGQGGMGGVC